MPIATSLISLLQFGCDRPASALVATIAPSTAPKVSEAAGDAAKEAVPNSVDPSLPYATVDVARVFQGYYKRTAAEAELTQLSGALDQRLAGAREELGRRAEALVKERDRVADLPQGVERTNAEQALRQQVVEGAQFERALQSTVNQYRQVLAQRTNERTQAIRAEINQAIQRHAERNELPLVLDTSATGPTGLAVFPYAHGGRDFSDELLEELNANRPPQIVAPQPDLTDLPTVEELLEKATQSAAETAPAEAGDADTTTE